MKKNRIIIFDTTLRDGEQCPGASMTLREKLEIARQLARLKVDVIEGGFPVISEGDFTAVNTIAREIKGPTVAGLARCVPRDIEAAGKAVAPAGKKARIHVFLATSKLHREFKLGKAQSQIIKLAVDGVKRARKLVADVEFSPEDAARTEPDFLAEVVEKNRPLFRMQRGIRVRWGFGNADIMGDEDPAAQHGHQLDRLAIGGEGFLPLGCG